MVPEVCASHKNDDRHLLKNQFSLFDSIRFVDFLTLLHPDRVLAVLSAIALS